MAEEDKIPRRGATLSLAKKLELGEEERGEKEDVEECPKELEKTEDIPEEASINEGNSSTNKENSHRRGPMGPSSLAPATQDKMHPFIMIQWS